MDEPLNGAQGTQLDRIEQRLSVLEGKIDATFVSAEKMRKYFMWSAIITLGLIILPLFALPFFISPFLAAQGVGSL